MSNESKNPAVETIKADVRDAVDEIKHRAQAAVDQTKATAHRVAADVDKAKREARHDEPGKDRPASS